MDIFIHRRDLRWQDNTGLLKSYEKYKNIVPIFIFNPEQIYPKNNSYFSNNLVQFMCESLEELSSDYKKKGISLNFFEGEIAKVLNEIHKKNKIKSITFNLDYSPFSKKRDEDIIKWCRKKKISVNTYEDMLLININEGHSINPNTQNPYVVYTPFMKNLRKHKVRPLIFDKINGNEILLKNKYSINTEDLKKYYKKNDSNHVISGRKQAIKILKSLKKFKNYNDNRNLLTYKTTHISSYINLGLVSIREVYFSVIKFIGPMSGIIAELYWRDFYYNILNFFPHIAKGPFKEKYKNIKWRNNKKQFEKWKNGETGFPVVDACMKQLNKTGFMHNRGRMIVASFLTKDLLIDWRWGEKYFAQNLIDYNISANNGGWQWAAGTGTDAQPYFRIFNPWTQSKNFDPDCKFIKKWLPELKDLDKKVIHNWNTNFDKYPDIYHKPVIDHAEARKKTLKAYKLII
jgi:deoxyribodipyrimidine photo-lyase